MLQRRVSSHAMIYYCTQKMVRIHQLEDYNEISEVADITAGDCSLEMVAGMLVLCLVSFISDRCNTKVNAFHSHYFPLCIQKWCISYSFFAQYGRKQKEVPNW